jgi:hypothetical protein
VTYPNVLVLDYIKSTNQATSELQMQAERFISLGYQRLLTFETSGGGFSLYGQGRGDIFLSAYGLMEIHDMSRVYPVDEALIERTARWLLARQQSDGSWQSDDYRASGALATTAYMAWALIEAGYGGEAEVQQAVSYLNEFVMQEKDPYVLALAANALAAHDPDADATRQLIYRLEEMKVVQGDAVYWPTDARSFMGAAGQSANVETTALVTYAFLRARAYPDSVQGALAYLVRAKDSWGTWGTTQATILTLKTLLSAATKGSADAGGEGSVQVVLNGKEARRVEITAENSDVVHLIVLSDAVRPEDNDLRLKVQTENSKRLNLMYQVTAVYYLPWEQVPRVEMGGEAISIEVTYDRTEIAVDDTVVAKVWVRLNQPGAARMVILDLGIPPGFEVLTEDLNALIAVSAEQETRVERYDLTGRQIILYLDNLSSERSLRLRYRLRARFPLRAKTADYRAYDYYNPEITASQAPTEMEVTGR